MEWAFAPLIGVFRYLPLQRRFCLGKALVAVSSWIGERALKRSAESCESDQKLDGKMDVQVTVHWPAAGNPSAIDAVFGFRGI